MTAAQRVPPPDAAPGPRLTPSTRAAIRRVPAVERYSPLVCYGSAIILPIIALAITMALRPYLLSVVFVFFWPAVIAAAVIGGFGPALVASLLSVGLADWFIIPPLGSISPATPGEFVRVAAFLITSLLVGSLTHKLQKERSRATEAATENARLAATLDQQTVELEQQLEESQSLQEELEQSSEELVERTAEAEAADRFSRSILSSISDPDRKSVV